MSSSLTRDARLACIEIAVGFAVLACVGSLLFLALGGGSAGPAGQEFRASFVRVDGLGVGADVRIAGVPVGKVVRTSIDPRTFLATVTFRVRQDIRLPDDTSASITSEGLLGGNYLSVSPGGDRQDLPPGGLITATQSAIGLQALLGQFVGSVTGLMDQVKASNALQKPAPASASGKPAPSGGGLGP